MLQAAQVLSSATLSHLEAAHRSRVTTARTLDLQSCLEANEIGGRTDMLGGHRNRVTHEEQDGNKRSCGKRAKPEVWSSE
jgi:hypothetical protein